MSGKSRFTDEDINKLYELIEEGMGKRNAGKRLGMCAGNVTYLLKKREENG